MAKLTPAEAREKHSRRLKGATEDIRRGIETVTVAPTKKAAEKIDKMKAKLMEAFDSGKVKRRLEAVTLEDWKDGMINKGLGRIASGVDGSAAKIEKFYGELFPFQDNLKRDVEKLPDVTLEDSINRMTTFIRGMAKFQRKG